MTSPHIVGKSAEIMVLQTYKNLKRRSAANIEQHVAYEISYGKMEAKLKKGKNIDHQGLRTIPNICHLPGPPILSHWLMLFFFIFCNTFSKSTVYIAHKEKC
jgi:hypothetical protein